jgi:hypothetical protein
MIKKVEDLRALCIDFIMNQNYTPESLVDNIVDLYKDNKVIPKEKVVYYIDYVIENAETDEEVMWCVNSIAHFIEFDLE